LGRSPGSAVLCVLRALCGLKRFRLTARGECGKLFGAGFRGYFGAGFYGSPALALAPGRFFHGMAPPGAENEAQNCDFGRIFARFRTDFDDFGRLGGALGIHAMCIPLC
jgi:hypothetical protein